MEAKKYHKHCKKCNTTKPTTEFFKNKSRYDGLSGYCKKCQQAAKESWVAKNRDRVNECARARKPDREKINTRRRKNQEWKKHKADPLKIKARESVRNAIRRGEIKKPSHCEVCEKPCNPQAHHDDYSKSLEVRFLCPQCHADYHRLSK